MNEIDNFHMLAGLFVNVLSAFLLRSIARSVGRISGPAFWATVLFSVLVGVIVLAISPKGVDAAPTRPTRRRGPDHSRKIPEHLRRRDPGQAPVTPPAAPPYARRPLG